jgi:hypothetical protein
VNSWIVKGRVDTWMATVDITMVRLEPVFSPEVVMPDGRTLSVLAVFAKKPMEHGYARAKAFIRDHASALGLEDS